MSDTTTTLPIIVQQIQHEQSTILLYLQVTTNPKQ